MQKAQVNSKTIGQYLF